MSYDVNSLRVGACRIIFGGYDLGYSKDGVTVDVKTTTRRQDIDHFTFVETQEIVVKREVSAKASFIESNFSTLKLLTGRANLFTNVIGGVNQLSLPVAAGFAMHNSGQELRLRPIERDYNDSSEDLTFVNAVWSGNITYTSKVDEVRMFNVEFMAYRDPTSDVLFKFGP